MAAHVATSLSSLSHRLAFPPKPLLLRHHPHKPSSFSFSHPPPLPLTILRCSPPEGETTEPDPDPDQEPPAYDEAEPASNDGAGPTFEGPMFTWPDESEEETAKAYERMYGPAFSGESYLNGDVYEMNAQLNKIIDEFDNLIVEKPTDSFEERVIQVRRVTKVVKGGKNMSFRAVVAVGDKKGHVGIGVAKALEVSDAIVKAVINGRRNIVTVPLTKHLTFPHRANGKFGSAEVMLRPAAAGSGVSAGGTVRTILELAGVQNALGKQLGSGNALNNARATIVATQQMKTFAEVALQRGIPVEELWK